MPGHLTDQTLTDALEAKALEIMAEVDRRGGVVACIESGFIQQQIQDSAYRYQQAIESGEKVVVGVNRFQDEKEPAIPLLRDLAKIPRVQWAAEAALRDLE